jgi:hypothetical protein
MLVTRKSTIPASIDSKEFFIISFISKETLPSGLTGQIV